MYQRRSNLQNLMILLLDCLTIVVSLILANYIRNGRLFESDDARMDFGLLLGAVLVVFLAIEPVWQPVPEHDACGDRCMNACV